MSEWISVEDRLPKATRNMGGSEFSDYVLVVDVDGSMAVSSYMYPWRNADCLGWTGLKNHCMDKAEVTHWMPLPEPPKESDDE